MLWINVISSIITSERAQRAERVLSYLRENLSIRGPARPDPITLFKALYLRNRMPDRQAVFCGEYHLDVKVVWHGYHMLSSFLFCLNCQLAKFWTLQASRQLDSERRISAQDGKHFLYTCAKCCQGSWELVDTVRCYRILALFDLIGFLCVKNTNKVKSRYIIKGEAYFVTVNQALTKGYWSVF